MSKTFEWCKDKTRLATCDKPVFCVNRFGDKCWYLNGKLHRENGPAVEHANGDKWWCLNGERHRENGPAVEYDDGYKAWWLNGQRHRVNGAAVEHASGTKAWYLNDIWYDESAYWKELKK